MPEKFEAELKPMTESHQKLLISADGRKLKISGVTELHLNIGGEVMAFSFHVLPHLSQNVILGANFLSHFRCHINCHAQTITFFDDDHVSFPLLQGHKNKDILGYLKETVILQPGTENLLPIFTKRLIKGEYYVEGLEPKMKQEYLIARTLATAMNKRSFCRVVNLSDAPVVLYKRTKLAVLVHLLIRL